MQIQITDSPSLLSSSCNLAFEATGTLYLFMDPCISVYICRQRVAYPYIGLYMHWALTIYALQRDGYAMHPGAPSKSKQGAGEVQQFPPTVRKQISHQLVKDLLLNKYCLKTEGGLLLQFAIKCFQITLSKNQ